MNRNDQLYRAYLDEMQSLNEFVMNYHTEHKFSGLKSELSSEDPDVNRLLESLGYFSARIHNSVAKNLQSYRYRLYQQLFPFLLTPIPATGIVAGQTSGLLTEPVRIDRGTDFILQTREEKDFFWQTLREATIHPIYVKSIESVPSERVGMSLLVNFACRHTLQATPDPLSILIDYIADIRSSFRLLTFFKDSLSSVRLYLGSATNLDERDEWEWIDLEQPNYGTEGAPLRTDQNDFLHPIETERLFFKDPRIELFVHLKLPKVEKPLNGFTIEFNFTDSWPKGLVANRDILVPNCIPFINLRQMPARPVQADGTITSFTILSGHEDAGFELCKPLGVYQLEKDGMTPLMSGVISRKSPCYEIESRVIEQRGRFFSNLIIHYPESFSNPVQLCVDALWHQPNFSDHRESPAEIRPYAYNIVGVRWEWAFLPSEKDLQPDMLRSSDLLLEILQISHKQYFGTEEIRSIMLLLGTIEDGPYRSVFAAFSASRYELRTIDNARLTPGHVIYFLTFDWDMIDRNDEFFRLFLRHLEIVLNHWSDGKEVKVSLDT